MESALSLLFNLPACGFLGLGRGSLGGLADVVAGWPGAGSWVLAVVRLVVLPTSWRVAGCRFFDPGGRPGPGLAGFGALAGTGSVWRRFRNPRRTRAGVRRPGWQGRCQGSRISAARGRARYS